VYTVRLRSRLLSGVPHLGSKLPLDNENLSLTNKKSLKIPCIPASASVAA